MTAPAITVEGVSKRYRLYHERNQSLKSALLRGGRAVYEEFWALRDVDLEVTEGRTFGLIGENGSGKSTLLKCMARILRPDAGSIRINGKVSALLELGAGFHHELSGRENVYLNGAILGMKKREIDRKFDEIVGFAGLERFIDVPVKNYSSGMYVRLGFSVAINVNPDVLLVDEVLAVGDEDFQRRCKAKFAELKDQGRTVVVVTHALDTVRDICDEAALLHSGEVAASGPALQVVERYKSDVAVGPDGHELPDHPPLDGDARLEHLELLGDRGDPTTCIRTGDAVAIRLGYAFDRPVKRPVFALSLHAEDGLMVSVAHSDLESAPEELDGRGHVDLELGQLPLAPGTYEVSGSVSEDGAAHNLGSLERAMRFSVEPRGSTDAGEGVLRLGGRWRIHHEPFG